MGTRSNALGVTVAVVFAVGLAARATLAAQQVKADFNGDGYADLATGVPLEDAVEPDAGAVDVLYGSADGLSGDSDQFWHQDYAGVEGVAESGDYFALALAAGDFDGDGYANLAIGVPWESVSGRDGAGPVNVLHGSASGLSADGDQFWHQDPSSGSEVASRPETSTATAHPISPWGCRDRTSPMRTTPEPSTSSTGRSSP